MTGVQKDRLLRSDDGLEARVAAALMAKHDDAHDYVTEVIALVREHDAECGMAQVIERIADSPARGDFRPPLEDDPSS